MPIYWKKHLKMEKGKHQTFWGTACLKIFGKSHEIQWRSWNNWSRSLQPLHKNFCKQIYPEEEQDQWSYQDTWSFNLQNMFMIFPQQIHTQAPHKQKLAYMFHLWNELQIVDHKNHKCARWLMSGQPESIDAMSVERPFHTRTKWGDMSKISTMVNSEHLEKGFPVPSDDFSFYSFGKLYFSLHVFI